MWWQLWTGQLRISAIFVRKLTRYVMDYCGTCKATRRIPLKRSLTVVSCVVNVLARKCIWLTIPGFTPERSLSNAISASRLFRGSTALWNTNVSILERNLTAATFVVNALVYYRVYSIIINRILVINRLNALTASSHSLKEASFCIINGAILARSRTGANYVINALVWNWVWTNTAGYTAMKCRLSASIARKDF